MVIGGNPELFEVSQWETFSGFSNSLRDFRNCPNLDITATDTPNLSQINNISQMFSGCSSLIGNASFSNWNTSTITDMNGMFSRAKLFNQNIGTWNTAKVRILGVCLLMHRLLIRIFLPGIPRRQPISIPCSRMQQFSTSL
jgi:surface protein